MQAHAQVYMSSIEEYWWNVGVGVSDENISLHSACLCMGLVSTQTRGSCWWGFISEDLEGAGRCEGDWQQGPVWNKMHKPNLDVAGCGFWRGC